MTNTESTFANCLNQAVITLRQLHTTELSNDFVTYLLGVAPSLSQWLEVAQTLALERAKNGESFSGFSLREGSMRRLKKEKETAAIEALRRAAPSLLPLCQVQKLAPISSLSYILGKERFDSIIAPFVDTIHWSKFIRDRK